jgi:site-specific recombinase XerD
MKVDLNTSRAYTRLKQLQEKYEDEDMQDIVSAILAHTMIYAIAKQTSPETYARDMEAIKAFYIPVGDKDVPVNPMIVKTAMLQKSIPLIIDSYEKE